jgi:hypothetical protein
MKPKTAWPIALWIVTILGGLGLVGCGGSNNTEDTNASTNHTPIAYAKNLTTNEDTNLPITLTASDEDNDTLQFIVTSGTVHGVIQGTAPNLVYHPETDFFGTDQFTFKVNDGTVDSAEATVTITVAPVNDAPVAVDDEALAVRFGNTITIDPLLNDTDIEGDTLSLLSITTPAHGWATITDGKVRYTPAGDYTGMVSFDYTVSDGQGGTDTATIAVTVEKGWNASAEMLENDNSAAVTPRIAMNGDGDAIVIWAQQRGTVYDLYSRFYRHNDGWDTIRSVENDLNATEQPQIAIAPNGNAIAVWREYGNGAWNIVANTYDAGSGQWGTPQLIEHLDTNASDPMIAMSANGDAVAVWWQYDTADWSIFANHFDAATQSWDGNAAVIEHGSGDAYDPKVAMDAHGNAIAIWRQYDSNVILRTYVNHYDAATHQWLASARTLDEGHANTSEQHIALDAAGNAVAVWRCAYQGTFRLFANQYIVTDTWQGEQIIQEDNRTVGNSTVAFDAAGNATALWTQIDPDGWRNLYANRLAAGATAWDGTVLVRAAKKDIYAPVLRFDAHGNGVAVYSQMNPDSVFDVRSVRYSPTRGWWGPSWVEDAKKDTSIVDLGVDDDGNAFAVWSQSDGTWDRIFYNRLQ